MMFLVLAHVVETMGTSDVSVTDIFKWITSGGIVGILAFVLIGGYKGWWVFGWQYRDVQDRIKKAEQERDDWRDIALTGTSMAERTVDLFKRSRGDK